MAIPTFDFFPRLLFAFVVFISAPAYAQTVIQSGKLGAYLGEKSQDLNQSGSNVLSMLGGANEAERHQIEMTYDYVRSAEDRFFLVQILADIHSQMKDASDQATTRRYLQAVSANTLKSTERTIDGINKQLVRARSPAFVAEAQKTRDQIIAIRNEIARVVPQKNELPRIN